ncbi:MAG: DMT family transporter [Sulfurovum sp.]|nr:DMT family transporter [Sulfurovum sp.]
MFMATLTFAGMGGFVKILSEELPSLEIAFFRNIFGVVIVGYSLYRRPMTTGGGKPLLLLFRGLAGFIALLAYFNNMANLPLGVAVTFNKTSPLFLAFFAWIFLSEKLPKTAILALLFGFMGITMIAKPEGIMALDKDILLGFVSGIGAALAYTSIRELKNYYDVRAIALSFMLVGTVGPILLMGLAEFIYVPKNYDFMIAKFIMPQGITWLYIVIAGLLATASQLLMTKAYSLTQAGIVGTITYTQILFAVIIGTVLGDSFPDMWVWVGMGLIIAAGLLVTLHKKK